MVTKTCLSLQKTQTQTGVFVSLVCVCTKAPLVPGLGEQTTLILIQKLYASVSSQFLTIDFLIFGYFTLWRVLILPLFWF